MSWHATERTIQLHESFAEQCKELTVLADEFLKCYCNVQLCFCAWNASMVITSKDYQKIAPRQNKTFRACNGDLRLTSIFVLIVFLLISVFFLVVTVFTFIARLGTGSVWLVIIGLIVARLTVFERRQPEILTTFGPWFGFGGLHWRRLLKTDDSYCTVTIIQKSVTLDWPDDSPGADDSSLKWFMRIVLKSRLAVHIRTVHNPVSRRDVCCDVGSDVHCNISTMVCHGMI